MIQCRCDCIDSSIYSKISAHSINASYSLYWDIVMDWGMMQNPAKVAATACTGGMAGVSPEEKPADCTHVVLRPRLRFGLWISVVILMTDIVLRFSWTLRFYHTVFPSADSFVLCTQFLEVFRYVKRYAIK